MVSITSIHNPVCQQILKLAKGAIVSGMALLEGIHLLRTYLDLGYQPSVVLIAQRAFFHIEVQELLSRLGHNVKQVHLPDTLFDRLAPVKTPIGVMAQVEVPVLEHSDYDVGIDTVVLDRVQDPQNVGSALRVAAAAGIKQVVLSEACAAPWGVKALRAGMGAQFYLNMYYGVAIKKFVLAYSGLVVATTCSNGAVNLFDAHLLPVTAWLMGNEGIGLDEELLASADEKVFIPISSVESLNVVSALSVCLFEQRRQRR